MGAQGVTWTNFDTKAPVVIIDNIVFNYTRIGPAITTGGRHNI